MQLLLPVVMLLDLCHKPLPLIFCQANDLILPGVHWWKREKDAAARGDVMLLDLCHKPDQPILCYCVPGAKWARGSVKSTTETHAKRQYFQYLIIQRLVLYLFLLRLIMECRWQIYLGQGQRQPALFWRDSWRLRRWSGCFWSAFEKNASRIVWDTVTRIYDCLSFYFSL